MSSAVASAADVAAAAAAAFRVVGLPVVF